MFSLYSAFHVELIVVCTVCRHEAAISEAVNAVGTSKSDKDISSMARQHTLEREMCDERWSKELSQLQESQRREYRDWVTTVHLDMETSRGKETSRLIGFPRK